jgi:hypothetical protein
MEMDATELARRAFLRKRGLKVTKRFLCAHDLREEPCPVKSGPCHFHAPFFDHLDFFRQKETLRLVLVSQPYDTVTESLTAAVSEWAAKFDLKFHISAEESWWTPGATVLIELWFEDGTGG